MEIALAILVGVLFATGVFCLLRRSIVKLILGIVLLSQGANLLVFVAGGLTAGGAALIPAGETAPPAGTPFADPLPQALVLTAIVIGFGIVAFALALVHRAHEAVESDDVDVFNRTDAA